MGYFFFFFRAMWLMFILNVFFSVMFFFPNLLNKVLGSNSSHQAEPVMLFDVFMWIICFTEGGSGHKLKVKTH